MSDKKLLLVDDHGDTCSNLSDILTDFGFTVDIANRGQEALDLFKGHPYRLALLDFKLPDINGIELFQRMRQIRGSIEGLLVTAYSSKEMTVAALAAGLRHVISKPVDVTQMMSLIEQALA